MRGAGVVVVVVKNTFDLLMVDALKDGIISFFYQLGGMNFRDLYPDPDSLGRNEKFPLNCPI